MLRKVTPADVEESDPMDVANAASTPNGEEYLPTRHESSIRLTGILVGRLVAISTHASMANAKKSAA